ncbi:MAG: hypothetical protein GF331_10960 [Chitinivibrionales bacterium]|nr:hypothetical protein [Chitinivibrionales bacterium]
MSVSEQEFVRELSQSPPLPDTLYPSVVQGIQRRRRSRTAAWALAASVAVAVGLGLFSGAVPGQDTPAAATDELAEEMYLLCDFVNGGSIDEELDFFAGGDAF